MSNGIIVALLFSAFVRVSDRVPSCRPLFAVYIDDICKLCDPRNGCFVILYADDIILITISVTMLQNLLFACEKELTYLDMLIVKSLVVCVSVQDTRMI